MEHPARALVKRAAHSLLERAGLSVRRSAHLPFGVSWTADARWCLQARPLETAFDVGANLGQTAEVICRSFPGCRVWCFEPVRSSFRRLQANTRRWPGVEAVHCALSARAGAARVSARPLSGCNRLLEPSADAGGVPTERAALDTVAGFAGSRGLASLDLLKVDTEGHELQVLQGADPWLADGRIRLVYCECGFGERSGEPHGSFHEIFGFLSRRRFRLVAFYSAGVDLQGWRWGNVLFRRVEHDDDGPVAMSPFRELPGR